LFNSSFPEYESCKLVAIPAKYDTKPYAYGFQAMTFDLKIKLQISLILANIGISSVGA
jgi:hypothetical protein